MSKSRRTAKKKPTKRKPAAAVLPPAAAQAAKPSDQPPASKQKAPWRMRSAKRLARAIFARNDPVELASSLLTCKGDATKAKTFFELLEYMYGKPGQQFEARAPEGQRPFQFVSYVPRPQYAVDPNSEDQRNKEACRQSLSGVPGAARTNFEGVIQEDGNDQHE